MKKSDINSFDDLATYLGENRCFANLEHPVVVQVSDISRGSVTFTGDVPYNYDILKFPTSTSKEAALAKRRSLALAINAFFPMHFFKKHLEMFLYDLCEKQNFNLVESAASTFRSSVSAVDSESSLKELDGEYPEFENKKQNLLQKLPYLREKRDCLYYPEIALCLVISQSAHLDYLEKLFVAIDTSHAFNDQDRSNAKTVLTGTDFKAFNSPLIFNSLMPLIFLNFRGLLNGTECELQPTDQMEHALTCAWEMFFKGKVTKSDFSFLSENGSGGSKTPKSVLKSPGIQDSGIVKGVNIIRSTWDIFFKDKILKSSFLSRFISIKLKDEDYEHTCPAQTHLKAIRDARVLEGILKFIYEHPKEFKLYLKRIGSITNARLSNVDHNPPDKCPFKHGMSHP